MKVTIYFFDYRDVMWVETHDEKDVRRDAGGITVWTEDKMTVYPWHAVIKVEYDLTDKG